MSALWYRLTSWWPRYSELPCSHPAIGGHDVVLWGDALVIYGECARCGR